MNSEITFILKSIAPTIMQSDALANPLHPVSKELKAITVKRKLTDADMERIAQIKFKGALCQYLDPVLGPFWPAQNVERMIVDAAKIQRRGQDVKRGLMVIDDRIPLKYRGPRTLEELYGDGNTEFVDIRSVAIGPRRVMQCRPRFNQWSVEFTVSYDQDIFNRETILMIMQDAGMKIGLSTYRPRFGRFEVASAT